MSSCQYQHQLTNGHHDNVHHIRQHQAEPPFSPPSPTLFVVSPLPPPPPPSSTALPEPLTGCEAIKLLGRLLECSTPDDVSRLLSELDDCYTQLFQLLLPPKVDQGKCGTVDHNVQHTVTEVTRFGGSACPNDTAAMSTCSSSSSLSSSSVSSRSLAYSRPPSPSLPQSFPIPVLSPASLPPSPTRTGSGGSAVSAAGGLVPSSFTPASSPIPCELPSSSEPSDDGETYDPRPLYVLDLSSPYLLQCSTRWEHAADCCLAQLSQGSRVCSSYLPANHDLVMLHGTCMEVVQRWRAQRPLLSHAITPAQLNCLRGFMAPIQSETIRIVGQLETQLRSGQQTVDQLQRRLKVVETQHISLQLSKHSKNLATMAAPPSQSSNQLPTTVQTTASTAVLSAEAVRATAVPMQFGHLSTTPALPVRAAGLTAELPGSSSGKSLLRISSAPSPIERVVSVNLDRCAPPTSCLSPSSFSGYSASSPLSPSLSSTSSLSLIDSHGGGHGSMPSSPLRSGQFDMLFGLSDLDGAQDDGSLPPHHLLSLPAASHASSPLYRSYPPHPQQLLSRSSKRRRVSTANPSGRVVD